LAGKHKGRQTAEEKKAPGKNLPDAFLFSGKPERKYD